MNPCPCGTCGSNPEKELTCSMSMIKSYYPKGTGKREYPAPCWTGVRSPLWVDIHVEVPRVPPVPFEYLKN